MGIGENDPIIRDNQPNTPNEPSNRLFLIVAGIITGLMLVTIAGISVYALIILPQQRDAQATQIALVDNQNTQAAFSAEQTIEVMSWTGTPTNTSVPDTATPTPTATFTPVVVDDEELSETPTENFQTATAEAQLTQMALVQSPTSTVTVTVQPATPTVTSTVQPATSTITSPVQPATSTITSTVQPATHTATDLPLTPTATSQPATLTATATPSALPETGFNDQGTGPMLVLMSLGLFLVILLARKLRSVS